MSDFDLEWYGEEIFTLATKENVRAMKKAALVVERAAKKIMGTGASRAFVKLKRSKWSKKKGLRTVYHRPSAPGFPPNIDYGTLRASIGRRIEVSYGMVNGYVGQDIEKTDWEYQKRRGEIPSDETVEYGYYLEVGTTNMAARPWLRPALRKSEKQILKAFREAHS